MQSFVLVDFADVHVIKGELELTDHLHAFVSYGLPVLAAPACFKFMRLVSTSHCSNKGV